MLFPRDLIDLIKIKTGKDTVNMESAYIFFLQMIKDLDPILQSQNIKYLVIFINIREIKIIEKASRFFKNCDAALFQSYRNEVALIYLKKSFHQHF